MLRTSDCDSFLAQDSQNIDFIILSANNIDHKF